MYRIEIDRSLCSGFGACAELAPDLFELELDTLMKHGWVYAGHTDQLRMRWCASNC